MSNELNHSGIKGQKWGIRRYQNEDRTWTAEGKIRYGRKSKSREREPTHDELMKSTNAKEIYKYRDRLSDQELQNRINRLNMERNLRTIKNDDGFARAVKITTGIITTAAAGVTIYEAAKKYKSGGVSVDKLAKGVKGGAQAAQQLFDVIHHSGMDIGDVPVNALRG